MSSGIEDKMRKGVIEIENHKINLIPYQTVNGYEIRPGFYEINGATAIPGGVNFTIHSNRATACELVLFRREENVPFAIIPFPENYRIGNVYSMIVFKLQIDEFEYCYRLDGPYEPERGLIFDKTKYLLDPYAKAVTGQSVWGREKKGSSIYKARVVKDDFDWGDSKQPLLPMEDLIIYELHVRGYTKLEQGLTAKPGTYKALKEKIPYLLELGVNAVELMPIFEFDEMQDYREWNGNQLIDYWGYNTVSFFSPNTGYSSEIEYNHEGNELKDLIKTCNDYGIEVILDVVFNHTAEGNEQGPFFSFKGFDNNIYYMLTPDGKYYNYSGCGNTLNCNHPIVQQMILECLRYWVTYYRIDGFRFDLASILGRNEDGSPMNKPPLIQSLAFDPILGKVKLIAEAWDAGGLYQVGSFPSWNRFAEWNGKYRDDIRGFLKGDKGLAQAAIARIMGSKDLYNPAIRGNNASVNFITCHDGFTLNDLYSYNEKHNEANGWNNTDGESNNRSWNCGVEGKTSDMAVNELRTRLIKNAITVLMLSRGTPMFLAGDEIRNTQQGNNNAYCQDNEISWIDWSLLEKNKDMFRYFSSLINYRKKHVIIRRDTRPCSANYPSLSSHNCEAWNSNFDYDSHYIGILYAGIEEETCKDDCIYMAVNTYWEEQKIKLPQSPQNNGWNIVFNTYEEDSFNPLKISDEYITIKPRTVMVLENIKE